MEKEMDFDIWDFDYEVKTAVIMYDKEGELIQRLVVDDLVNMSIDYTNKVFHAEYNGEEDCGIEKGKIFNISFHKMVIV